MQKEADLTKLELAAVLKLLNTVEARRKAARTRGWRGLCAFRASPWKQIYNTLFVRAESSALLRPLPNLRHPTRDSRRRRLQALLGDNVALLDVLRLAAVILLAEIVVSSRDRMLGVTIISLATILFAYRRWLEARYLAHCVCIDGLTGMCNRQHAFWELEAALRLAHRYKRPLSLIVFDLDEFKHINDHYGHLVGDRVLIAVAEITFQTIRATDIAARWGGEEFIVIMPESDFSCAVALAERLRVAIARGSGHDNTPQATASFGVAELQAKETLNAFVERADHALYEAKTRGRNQVIQAVR